MPPASSARNAALAGALVIFGCGCAALPFVLARTAPTNLYAKDAPLSGSSVSRGPFLNSGSKDVGKDPDWVGGVWRGKRNGGDSRDFSPSAGDIERARLAVAAKSAPA